MNQINLFDKKNKPTPEEKNEIIHFLYEHLENFGDSKEDIEKCLNYALQEIESFGGFILQSKDERTINSVVVINKTGMNGYIPENILVYIATHKDYRGKGIGKMMVKKVIELVEGNIALHVEPDNPAKFLYEKIGFTNKYLEMRYQKNK